MFPRTCVLVILLSTWLAPGAPRLLINDGWEIGWMDRRVGDVRRPLQWQRDCIVSGSPRWRDALWIQLSYFSLKVAVFIREMNPFHLFLFSLNCGLGFFSREIISVYWVSLSHSNVDPGAPFGKQSCCPFTLWGALDVGDFVLLRLKVSHIVVAQ